MQQHPLAHLTPHQQQQLLQQHPQYAAQHIQQQAIYQQKQMPPQHQTYQQLPKPNPQYDHQNIYQPQVVQPAVTQAMHPQQYQQQQQPQQQSQLAMQQIPPLVGTNRFYPAHTVSLSPKHQVANLYAGSTANFTAATLRRPPQQHSVPRDPIDAIPNSTIVDNAMYERDKQIYKCSTLRPGGKFDKTYGPAAGGGKPSILNCPLPEIPRDARNAFNENGDATSPPNRNGHNVGVVHPTMTR